MVILLITLGGILATIAGFWQYRREHSKQPLLSISPGVLTFMAGVLVIVAGVLEYRASLAEFNTTIATITGGDSFVTLDVLESEPATTSTDLREIDLQLRHHGEFTVYDISVVIEFVEEDWLPTRIVSKRQFAAVSPIHGSLEYNDSVYAWDVNVQREPPLRSRLMATLVTRNGSYVQYIELENIDNLNWLQRTVLLNRNRVDFVTYASDDSDDLLRDVSRVTD